MSYFSFRVTHFRRKKKNVGNSKVGKQTKRLEIVIHKNIKLTVGVKYSIRQRTTLSPNPHLVEEATCFPYFAP